MDLGDMEAKAHQSRPRAFPLNFHRMERAASPLRVFQPQAGRPFRLVYRRHLRLRGFHSGYRLPPPTCHPSMSHARRLESAENAEEPMVSAEALAMQPKESQPEVKISLALKPILRGFRLFKLAATSTAFQPKRRSNCRSP